MRRSGSAHHSGGPALARSRAGRFFGLLTATAIGAGALIAAAAPGVAYRDGPPPGFSGGFGEQSCDACHFSNEVNAAGGSLEIGGSGEEFVPGKSYPITITLARRGVSAVGGFQLTARFADDGAQAGTLEVDSADADRIAVTTDREVQYAYQRLVGSVPAVTDSFRWVVRWTAPATGRTVIFHAAANASDGDGSASGDYVYTAVDTSSLLKPGGGESGR